MAHDCGTNRAALDAVAPLFSSTVLVFCMVGLKIMYRSTGSAPSVMGAIKPKKPSIAAI